MSRCESRVYWWDIDLSVRCIRAEHSDGAHTDGLRWWDPNGLQVDGADHTLRPRTPAPAYRQLTPRQVKEIRARFADGETVGQIAGATGVCRSTVYQVAHRRTYRSVA